MSDQITITLTESQAEAMEVLLRDVELLNVFLGNGEPLQIVTDLVAIHGKIIAKQSDPYFNCSVEYFNGERWVFLSHPKRFWERRRFASHQAAREAVAEAKQAAPDSFRYRVMKNAP